MGRNRSFGPNFTNYVVLTGHYKEKAMAFIGFRNIKRDGGAHHIRIGIDSRCQVQGGSEEWPKGRSKQAIGEKPGRPILISDDRKSRIFLSPVRGVVPYDVVTDTFGEVEEDDPRIVDAGLFPTPAVHTEFGDGYVFLHFLESTGPGKVLRGVFQKEADYQRVFSHIYHTVMKNSERVRCDVFLERSFIRHPVSKVPTSCLKGDTAYCAMMGADRIRTGFFKAYVKFMRKAFPGFGKACYVDSAPLPNDTDDDPFDAFTDHGTGSSGNRMRMAVVLDSKMGLPVWFDIHSGDVLDARYASGELIRSFPTTVEGEESDPADTDDDVGNIVVRMPARRGHPYKTPYHRCKPLMGNGKYDLVRTGMPTLVSESGSGCSRRRSTPMSTWTTATPFADIAGSCPSIHRSSRR